MSYYPSTRTGIRMVEDWVKHSAPDFVYAAIASSYWILHPGKKTRITYPKGNCWRVWARGERYFTLRNNAARGSEALQTRKFNRYNFDGFCSVSASDTVVDVGAFLGEFSLPAARIADQVIAVEPDPNTYSCLQQQIQNYDNIIALNMLPAEESRRITFNVASDPSESSTLRPDASKYQEMEMQALPLDEILNQIGVSKVDFLKIDAEGAEPEVLRGIDTISIEKIAVDSGKERGGEESTDEVRAILESRGYETKVKEDQNGGVITFAK